MNRKTKEYEHDFHTFFSELNGESDRGCAIVGAAILDDLLGQVLEEYLLENNDSKSEILNSKNQNAPLGSFGSRISVAYGIGLLTKSELEALRIIKGIRNDFAHDLGRKFDEESISSRCKRLIEIVDVYLFSKNNPSSREIFQAVVSFFFGGFKEKKQTIIDNNFRGNFGNVISK